METKHTPGPWYRDEDSVFTRAELTDGGDIVCMSPEAWGFSDSGTRWAGNASLITAAPDLLAACIAWRDSTNDEEEFAALNACEAAIAKATGTPAAQESEP